MDAFDDFFATVDWGEITLRLTLFAVRRGVPPDDAEEVVQEAFSQLFDPDYKEWSPDVPSVASLMRHLGSTVNGIIMNKRRRQGRWGPAVDLARVKLSNGVTADRERHSADWQCEVLGRLDGDDDACSIFYLIVDDVPKAADEAAELGWPVARVYEARRRLRQKLRNPSEDV